ncbi:MAG TPA: hypothetical protein VFN68_01455 [Acidimicrobiales bacterium]|nr:hypothetical protein [Acidimicrobiales bacterium]
MGSSPGEVAGRLADEGVRGIPAEVSECVLARYLQAVIGAEMSVRRVVVKERSVRVYRAGNRLPALVAIPVPVSKFIRAFDAGCYPELIDGLGILGRAQRPAAGGAGASTQSSGLGLFS